MAGDEDGGKRLGLNHFGGLSSTDRKIRPPSLLWGRQIVGWGRPASDLESVSSSSLSGSL